MAYTNGECDVLVVGAGPVGLLAAAELARHGASVRIVDAASGPAVTSRALNLHARTLEVFDALGIADEVLARGRETVAFERHVAGRPSLRHEFAHRGRSTRFDFMLIVDQVITEEVLRAHLARQGHSVEWGTRLTGFTDTGSGVTARLQTVDGTREAAVGWLVGCDGAHSVVRRQLGIPLLGDSTATWLVADARVETDLDPRAAHWLHDAGGALMMFSFPEAGKWRLVDTAVDPADGAAPDPAALAELFGRRLSAASDSVVDVAPPTWASRFTIQQRAVPRMLQGRCLVAGDAAHVHSPAGGQGMNTGLQDAVNLGWKLAAVVRGLAEPTLLDTYSAERVPVGAALLDSTAAVTHYVTGDDLRDDPQEALAEAGRTIIAAANGLAVAYPDSPLTSPVPHHGVGPQPGQRITQVTADRAERPGWRAVLAQLSVPAWTVLVAGAVRPPGPGRDGPAIPESFDRWGEVLSVEDPATAADLGVADHEWILVRPDGYVAARGGADVPLPTPAGYC